MCKDVETLDYGDLLLRLARQVECQGARIAELEQREQRIMMTLREGFLLSVGRIEDVFGLERTKPKREDR